MSEQALSIVGRIALCKSVHEITPSKSPVDPWGSTWTTLGITALNSRIREHVCDFGWIDIQRWRFGPLVRSLSSEAGAAPLPAVMALVHNHSSRRFVDNLAGYRDDRYVLIGEDAFVCHTRT
ncbi:hypothetical protein EVAR_64750_1 [Eumeta japonica]|uniref:Uncharacterized protein n=1 Tax=Eumeta variegata TaxID=151549 RepID=A0A4C1ZB63_EUMVA|nr:hypothetical protein EVAR_64750_1 [Eumeta japonica]